MNHQVVLILPFFGKLPPYFGLFLTSLKYVDMDVAFFSDQKPESYPDNFKIHPMTLPQLRALAEEKLHASVALDSPKRLCDFKPLYGRMFEDYIADYQYWAFGDCDLVFGEKLNAFIKGMVLAGKYDVISMRRHWISGPLTFLKNTPHVRTLYRLARNWEAVVAATGENTMFDECGGMWHTQLESGSMSMSDCEKINDSFAAVVWRSSDLNFYHEDEIAECPLQGTSVKWHDGKLTLQNKELLVYHYIVIKWRRYCKFVNVPFGRIRRFVIDDAGSHVNSLGVALCPFANIWRKTFAFLESIRINGLRHWLKRLST